MVFSITFISLVTLVSLFSLVLLLISTKGQPFVCICFCVCLDESVAWHTNWKNNRHTIQQREFNKERVQQREWKCKCSGYACRCEMSFLFSGVSRVTHHLYPSRIMLGEFWSPFLCVKKGFPSRFARARFSLLSYVNIKLEWVHFVLPFPTFLRLSGFDLLVKWERMRDLVSFEGLLSPSHRKKGISSHFQPCQISGRETDKKRWWWLRWRRNWWWCGGFLLHLSSHLLDFLCDYSFSHTPTLQHSNTFCSNCSCTRRLELCWLSFKLRWRRGKNNWIFCFSRTRLTLLRLSQTHSWILWHIVGCIRFKGSREMRDEKRLMLSNRL